VERGCQAMHRASIFPTHPHNSLPSYSNRVHSLRNLEDIIDGHKSFPSGHSSTIFAGMGFLFFWLAGKTAAWCFSEPLPPRSILSSRLGRIVLTLVPLMIGSWVAITRLEDYVRVIIITAPSPKLSLNVNARVLFLYMRRSGTTKRTSS
jgi:membrane-associated phospholipid phosphatase